MWPTDGAAEMPDDNRMPALLDVFKLIICDARCLEEGTSLQDAYDAQLREEELQTPTERAREIVRCEIEKTARRNARLIIPHLEHISPDELTQMERNKGDTIKAIWKQIAPPPPAWIQQIVDSQQPWGFVFYKSREVERKFGYDWYDVWGEIKDYLSEDDALRRHFKDYKESLSSPGFLRNTFIMINDQCIPEDIRRNNRQDIDDFWVWAYDADWEPSADITVSNGDEYRGRVRVPLYSLNAWFYGARYEGVVSLKDMWLKAQTDPEKLWICRSKLMESWHHESYI
ncbi:hypothetical protein G7Z17_g7034 [Cylindrodendrum hubeiense]|uniref:Uncharacterized protein n=1 Tax=Cylindrodendrum hubeiense TaxID=595255 RepID=A0A9P5H9T3_9HYPO|nr:hypothetical protein G7Z17_g7034 [Cylindrodendrum hubeiense]